MSMILDIVGGVVGAIGAAQEAEGRAQSAEYNARVAKINADASRKQGAAESARQRRENARILGQMRTAFGSSGLVYTGSLLDVFEDSYAEGELDVATIRYQSEVRAIGYENQSELDTAEAGNARTAGMFNAAGSLIGGAARAASRASNTLFPTG